MSIRRPPTAITLKPSDVAEMAELIALKNAKAAGADEGGDGKAQANGRDSVVDKERKERQEKEARSRGERVGV
jgi:hypothetical protein